MYKAIRHCTESEKIGRRRRAAAFRAAHPDRIKEDAVRFYSTPELLEVAANYIRSYQTERV